MSLRSMVRTDLGAHPACCEVAMRDSKGGLAQQGGDSLVLMFREGNSG